MDGDTLTTMLSWPYQRLDALIVTVSGDEKTYTLLWTAACLVVCFLAVLPAVLHRLYFKSAGGGTTTPKSSDAIKTKTTKKKKICPFSAESAFIVEAADDLPPAPLELLQSWSDPSHPDFGKPLAARWLNAGISGQDTPGMLRAGLKRLADSKFFLVQEPFRLNEELNMKKKALDNKDRFPQVFVAEDDAQCMVAQQECLDLFLSYLPKRYPDLYKYDSQTGTIRVLNDDAHTYTVGQDFVDRPLELCERLVQEDLVLMRPPRPEQDETQYMMAAAAVVFSFNELPEKLSKPVSFLHAPVPGYQEHLRKTLDLTFSRILKVEQPKWRNNWGIAPSGSLDEPLYGSTDAHENRTFEKTITVEDIKAKFLKVEYQTIRRLPKSGYLLFTIKTMADPLSSLEEVPNAAACLAKSIRGMSTSMRAYKGIQNEETCKVLLKYLDDISAKQT
jgi:hypothetical protein